MAYKQQALRELALFAGAGGGILGGKLLGWRTVCAVEWEPYPAAVLAARQNEGFLPPFPIWDDVQNAYICDMEKKVYVYGSPRKCLMCDTVFTPRDKSSQAKYCSYSCNNKSRRIHKLKPCVICGTEFTPIRNGWVCCSRACGTKYRLSRRKCDPIVVVRKKLATTCCGMIARSLRGKTDKTRNLLGYSVDQLRTHLESKFVDGMGWHNYGKGAGQWSIDHIRPISKFPESARIREINSLENLQPLWHSENCRKKNKWDVQ